MTFTEKKTVCARDCYDSCFLIVKIENGQIISIRGDSTNPVTRGISCPRCVKDNERLKLNRLSYPHIKQKKVKQDHLVRSSWDEALKSVVGALKDVINDHGSQSVLHLNYAGNTGLLTWYYPSRIWNALGAVGSDNALCSQAGNEALSLHYGSSYGIQPEEIEEKKAIIYWGFNAVISSPHMWNLSLLAKKKGAVIAAIDSRESETARKSDLFLCPKPGSDVVLAHGIAREMITKDYIDRNFIESKTTGFSEYKKIVEYWTPERVKKITGIDKNQLSELARIYGTKKPSVSMIGIGLQKSINGGESVRAISLLPALAGMNRGFFYSNGSVFNVDFDYLTGKRDYTANQVALSKRIEEGEFKFIFISGMNPAITLPNSKAFRRGLERDDVFSVVHETHWTETAKLVDVALPAPAYLEKDDIVIPWSHRHVRLSNKIISPPGECRDEALLMIELAERLGLKELLKETKWEAVERALEDTFEDGEVKDLFSGKTLELKLHSPDVFQTPSGKIEFYSSKAINEGFNAIPNINNANQEDGTFILLNSCLSRYTHTQFQEVYGQIPAIVHVNQSDADLIGIENSDTVVLYNKLGEVAVKAVVSYHTPEGILWSPKLLTGIDGNPLNVLSSNRRQLIGGGSTFNSISVRIRKRKKK